MKDASFWVEYLKLERHPEGGYYKETYRSEGSLGDKNETTTFPNARPFGTAIYFMMESGDFSAFHRIKSDEVWHFYTGGPLEVIHIDSKGHLNKNILGSDIANNQSFQMVVPANCWFGSRPLLPNSYSLVGCTVAPGFDFQDFEMADRESLLKEFPEFSATIIALTRETC